ncbi:MAG: response regulator [Clostridia bacterium]|jgi:CheY-like chemotaxis protein|nr:response regulator [Clostridia bacterium]
MEKKVLLVDDEVDFVKVNKVTLEKKGYKVVAAYDGTEALRKALQEKPDIIILDVMLKKKTEGFDVSRELREHKETRDTPIILLTAIKENMDIEGEIEPDKEWLPVTEFLEKPVSPDELVEKIAKVLGRRKKMSL